jgi:hypothetical protein
VLVSGEKGTDAAELAAAFTADERLVTTYWLELNHGSTGDVYGAVPGADFELLDHDGTWADIHGQLAAAWEVAREVAADGGPPSALVINGMSTEWSMLSDLADRRARRRVAAELIHRGLDPAPAYSSEVEVEVKPDLWTLVGRRHRQLMGKILTWPGPVILTAREERTPEGRWVLKAQETLGSDVTAWVRLTRDDQPQIVSLITPQRARFTSTKRRELRAKFSLSRLVWDWCGVTVDTPMTAVRVLDADQVMPGEEPPVRSVPSRNGNSSRPTPPPPPPPVAAPAHEDDAPLPSGAATVVYLADRWLELDRRDHINALWAEMDKAGAAAMATDVAGLLTPEERKALDVADEAVLTLRDLATELARRIHTTGTALRAPVQAGAA